MKKALSLIAISAMVIGLSGCIDKQDGSQQKVSGSTSTVQL